MLIPKLEKAVENGEEAMLLSVFSAGSGGHVKITDMKDLGFTKGSSLKAKADAAVIYNDLMIEVLYRL